MSSINVNRVRLWKLESENVKMGKEDRGESRNGKKRWEETFYDWKKKGRI